MHGGARSSFFLGLTCLVTACVVRALFAADGASPRTATVTLSSGEVLQVRLDGSLNNLTYQGTTLSVSWNHIASLERTSGEDAWRVALVGGPTAEGVKVGTQEPLRTEDAWGTVRTEWAKVRKLEVQHAGPPPAPRKAGSSEVTWEADYAGNLASSVWCYTYPPMNVTVGEFGIDVPWERITALTCPADGRARIAVAGGKSFEGALTTSTFRFECAWGSVVIPRANLRSLRRVGPPPTDAVARQPEWRITATDGSSLDVASVEGLTARAYGLDLTDFSWAAAVRVEKAPDGKALIAHLSSGGQATLQGDLRGGSAFGQCRISVERTAALTRLTPGPAVAPAAAFSPEGSLYLRDGTAVPLASPTITSCDYNRCSAKRLCLSSPTNDWWVEQGLALKQGFAKRDGQLVVEGLTPVVRGTPVSRASMRMTGVSRAGGVRIELESEEFAGYRPAKVAAPTVVVAPRKSVTVRIVARGGEATTLEASPELQFARYPATCWTGTYSYWPFGWYMDGCLTVKAPAGQREVGFQKLAKIEIPEPYGSGRTVSLLARSGEAMTATVYPGDTNEKTKSGPSAWDSAREGILCSLADGLQAFIPFARVKEITFTWPASSPAGH